MLALPHLSSDDVIRALARLGFRAKERRGRITLRPRDGDQKVVVPPAATLGPAVVASIVRAAGVDPLAFLLALDDRSPMPRPRESTRSLGP